MSPLITWGKKILSFSQQHRAERCIQKERFFFLGLRILFNRQVYLEMSTGQVNHLSFLLCSPLSYQAWMKYSAPRIIFLARFGKCKLLLLFATDQPGQPTGRYLAFGMIFTNLSIWIIREISMWHNSLWHTESRTSWLNGILWQADLLKTLTCIFSA